MADGMTGMPSWWLNQLMGNQGGVWGGGGDSGMGGFKPYRGLMPEAYGNLMNILMSQGRTDPALMNRQIAQIGSTTQAGQQAAAGRLAGMGLEGSMAGQGLLSAIGQSGVGQVADLKAREAAAAEERRRQDLMLWLQTYLAPRLTRRGQNIQQYIAQLQAAAQGGGGGIWGPIMSAVGSYFGSRGQ